MSIFKGSTDQGCCTVLVFIWNTARAWSQVLLGYPQLYNKNRIHGTLLWRVIQVLSPFVRTAYQVVIALVLLSLVCKSEYLKGDEYVLDDTGQLIEMPLLV